MFYLHWTIFQNKQIISDNAKIIRSERLSSKVPVEGRLYKKGWKPLLCGVTRWWSCLLKEERWFPRHTTFCLQKKGNVNGGHEINFNFACCWLLINTALSCHTHTRETTVLGGWASAKWEFDVTSITLVWRQPEQPLRCVGICRPVTRGA